MTGNWENFQICDDCVHLHKDSHPCFVLRKYSDGTTRPPGITKCSDYKKDSTKPTKTVKVIL